MRYVCVLHRNIRCHASHIRAQIWLYVYVGFKTIAFNVTIAYNACLRTYITINIYGEIRSAYTHSHNIYIHISGIKTTTRAFYE